MENVKPQIIEKNICMQSFKSSLENYFVPLSDIHTNEQSFKTNTMGRPEILYRFSVDDIMTSLNILE